MEGSYVASCTLRDWLLLLLLFQIVSAHVLPVRQSADVTRWRWKWPSVEPDAWSSEHQQQHGGWLGHHQATTPHSSAYKSGPPHGRPTEDRTAAPSPPPSYQQTHTLSSSTMAPAPVPTHTKAPSPSPSPIMANTYRANVLHQHNLHRKNHSANAIAWDHELTSIALEIAQSCVFAHNVTAGGGGYGQNIAAGTTPQNVAQIITNEFYNNEEPWFDGLYGLAQPPMTNFEHWGHFSQVVWNNSKTVGCATVNCPKGVKNVGSNVPPYFTVCNYKPPGNFQGQYGKNIGKPLGHPTVTIPPAKDNSKGGKDSKGSGGS